MQEDPSIHFNGSVYRHVFLSPEMLRCQAKHGLSSTNGDSDDTRRKEVHEIDTYVLKIVHEPLQQIFWGCRVLQN